jgi:peptidoglycan L-alanyl-D-glutamate endopeptidase CwlK
MLSERSIRNLQGVHPDLVRCVEMAHDLSKYDFIVVEGLRTEATQRAYIAKGASRTMRSYHIIGRAVDLIIIENGKIYEGLDRYAHVADCMDEAADELGIDIKWGAVWDKPMSDYDDANAEFKAYVRDRRYSGTRPFVDAVHFQIEPYEKW